MNHINKTPLRKITVDGEVYLWKRGHYHLPEFTQSACVEKVIIYLEGFKNAPLHLLFREEDNWKKEGKWQVGYPDAGVIWRSGSVVNDGDLANHHINLNRPAVIASLIRYFIEKGWQPRTDSKPFLVEDALRYLAIIDLPKRKE